MEKVKILVVEDDEQLMQTIESLLKLEGFEVHAATNGKIGFDQYMRCKPHLIVCDIMMPILSGLELFKKLQEEIENFATPFIFLTARAELQEIRQGMLLGADDYITKPFDNEDLVWAIKVRLEKIDRLVRQHGQNEEGNGLSLDWEKITCLPTGKKH
ncbi:MAG: response regulator [Bacteroidales bacterium]|nr:response regulator [Bacteroidales bacterium]